jgi:hypothetical protein
VKIKRRPPVPHFRFKLARKSQLNYNVNSLMGQAGTESEGASSEILDDSA